MACCGNRKKQTREFADQKWDYINLQDFKATGCGAPFAYGYLWFSLFLSVAVYAVDSFTAVQLLAFNRWSSSIRPAISFDVSKWIFSICIILSFVNLGFEAIRATRVIKRNNIAECYMDPLAVRWQSIRVGKGQGWRRFLVFAALTKSKQGAEYVALFTYFGFKSWIRVLVCSGPRQVINAFTLRSVYVAKLSTNAKSVDGAFLGFFGRVKILAEEDYRQAVILSGMAFTFIIWAFALIFLIIAILFYVFFLFHWIPRADGGLTGYCERKINKALLKIVTKRVNKALAKNQASRMKADAKAAKKTGEMLQPERTATLPDVGAFGEDKLPGMPVLGRVDTGGSLPPYTARPNTPRGIEMNNLNRPGILRAGTNGSNSSFSPSAPLMSAAADMGYGPVPRVDQRPGTAMSQRSQASRPNMGNQYGYGNAPSPRPGMQRPMAPPMAPAAAPPMAFGYSSTAPVEEFARDLGQPTLPHLSATESTSQHGLEPSNSEQSIGSYSVSSMGASTIAGSEHELRQGAMSMPPQTQGMQAPAQKQYRPYDPNVGREYPPANNSYPREPSPELYATPVPRPVRSATAGPMLGNGSAYPAQRSVTAPGASRAATFDTYQQRSGAPQNTSFAPVERSNTGEEFSNGRWVPPSQRNNPSSYDLEAQYNERKRYQY